MRKPDEIESTRGKSILLTSDCHRKLLKYGAQLGHARNGGVHPDMAGA